MERVDVGRVLIDAKSPAARRGPLERQAGTWQPSTTKIPCPRATSMALSSSPPIWTTSRASSQACSAAP